MIRKILISCGIALLAALTAKATLNEFHKVNENGLALLVSATKTVCKRIRIGQ